VSDSRAPIVDAETADAPPSPARLAGVIGGLAAATCCIGPAVGVAMGVSSGSFLIAMRGYRPALFVLGALLALSIGGLALRRRRASCPTPESFRILRSTWISAGLLAFAVTYGVGRFIVAALIERS